VEREVMMLPLLADEEQLVIQMDLWGETMDWINILFQQ
jgi:hypothetical protein